MLIVKNTFIKLSFISLIFLLFSANINAQNKEITGTILGSSDNLSIPGVNIVIKGTFKGTVTDFSGNYTITVPNNETTLTFSCIGYESKDVLVGTQTTLNVVMEEENNLLDDIVVVGYGVQKKSDVSGSISSVSAEELTVRPVASLDMAIQGKASGVQISSTSGMPGSTASIRIRGHGSLGTSNAPLWVIDGYVGGDMNSVAPEDIQSIEILKDASSTAIYGARGGNGVIIVTTKKGTADQTTVSFSHYTQVKTVIKRMDVLTAPEYMELRNQAILNDGGSAMFSADEIALTAPVGTTGYIADTDWQDEVFQTGISSYYSLGITGGSGKTRYALSANTRTDGGVIPNSSYKRSGINLNLSHDVSDFFDFGTSIKGYMSKQEGFDVPAGAGWSFGPAGYAVSSLPYYPVRDSIGDFFNTSTWDNPIYATEAEMDHRSYNNAQGNVYLNFKPITGLSIRSTISGEARLSSRERFVSGSLYEATTAKLISRASITQGNYYKWVGNVVATYMKTINGLHDVSAMVGVEQQIVNSSSHGISVEDASKESLLWYDVSAYNTDYHVLSSDYWNSAFRSQFSRLSYGFNDKYLLMSTIRRDGSSKFGASNQYGVFPSVSAAWKIHHENFLANSDIFNQLKLRLSWGQSGNDQIPLYQWSPAIAYNMGHTSAVFGDQLANGAVITKIPNQSITWETSTTTNVGLDMAFLENRLNVNIDMYDRTTSNLLWADLLPLYTGYGAGWYPQDAYFPASVWTNYAQMNNKGIELGLSAIIVDKNDWNFELNLNLASNKNEVTDLGDQTEFYTGITKVEVGQPIGNIYGYKFEGLYSIEDSDAGLIPVGKEPGDQKFADLNKDGIVNSEDQEVIGNALPKFTSGVNYNLSYKNVSLSMNWNIAYGNDMYNGTYQTLAEGSLLKYNGGKFLLDAWTPDNTDTDVPRLSSGFFDLDSDRYVEDASFVKLTNTMVSYNLPTNLVSKIKVKSLRIYVSGQNLLVFTKYSGFDPEQSSGGDSNLNLGYDSKNYPTSRSFTFGLNLTL